MGAVICPFLKNPFGKQACFSPIDTRPKKDSEELRIIINLSYLFQQGSVNESIFKTKYVDNQDMNIRYPTIHDLCNIICKKYTKEKVKLMKCDLKHMYQQLYSCHESIMWLGFTFKGKIYINVVLNMGSRSATYCCQWVTNTITHVYSLRGFDNVNYLDDLGIAKVETLA